MTNKMLSIDNINKETFLLLERNNVLETIIRKELILDSIGETKLELTDQDRVKKDFLKTANINSEEDFNNWLSQQEYTKDDFLETIQLPHRINKYCKKAYGHMAHGRFLKRKIELDQVIYSLIRVQDIYLAMELYQRIFESEANFGDLAKEFSCGNEKNSRGIVGPVFINQSHPILAEKIRSSKPDVLIEPFKIDSLWLILRTECIIEVSMNEDIENMMVNEIFQESISEKVKSKLNQIKAIHNT